MHCLSYHARLALSSIVICLAVLVAACSPQAAPLPPPGTFAPQSRDLPTLPPPAWVEGSQPVTVSNANQLAYIGRLDTLSSAPSTVFAYAFSPDNSRLAGLNNEQLVAWDLLTGKVVFNTARGDAQYVFYGVNKSEIYTLNAAGVISIFDADSGRFKDGLQGQPSFNSVVAYYADEGWLALGGLDGSVKIWDVAARQSLVTIQAHRLQVTGLSFSSDGQQLATSSDDQVVNVWDWHSRQMLVSLKAAAQKTAFAPDGSQLAAGEAQTITLWSLRDGSLQNTLNTGPAAISDVLKYSPDGNYLINVGGGIPAMTVWNPRIGGLVNVLPGVGGDITSAAFSPDGGLLVTSVLGGSVVLWDVSHIADENLIYAQLNVGTRQMVAADWSGDGYALTLFDGTGPIQLWGIPPPAS